MKTLSRFLAPVLLALVAVLPVRAQQAPAAAPSAAAEAFARLAEGNARFVARAYARKDLAYDRAVTVDGQHPYAVVLTCADSRVPPEYLFDESLGRLFVVRVAGNVVDPVVLGSIEYAAEHLHVPAVYVLGHSHCGAVKATIEGGHVPPNIAALAERIAPAVAPLKARALSPAERLGAAVRENVLLQIDHILQESDVLREMVGHGQVEIRGGVYDLESGRVDALDYDPLSGRITPPAAAPHAAHPGGH